MTSGSKASLLARIACLLFALLCAASPASAQTTVTLDVTADTYLRSGSANQNQGGETLLSLQDNRRGLVRVDQSYVSAALVTGTVVSATLQLYG